MIFDRLMQAAPRADVSWSPLDDRWFSTLGSYSSTFSGFPIGPDTAARVSAVFACNSLRADTIASLPCILYRRTDDKGGKERARDHRLYRVMRQRPNGWMTPADLFGFGEWHCGLRGGVVYEIQDRGRAGAELVPHHPAHVTVEQLPSTRLRYEVRNPKSGERRTLLQDEVLHVRDLTMDGIEGLARATLAREAIAVAAAGEAFVGGFFKHDATGRLVLEHPSSPKDEEARQQFEQRLRENYQGWQNSRRPLLLYGDMKAKEIGGAGEEEFLVDPRKFQVADIARYWRVPGFMIGLEEKSTSWGSGIEQQKQGWVDFTIRPIVTRWEQAMNRALLFEDEQEELFFEFLLADLLRGDLKSRTEALATQHDHGVISPNEWRRFENMNEREGGDEYRETPTGAAPNAGPRPGAPVEEASTVPPELLVDAARRVVAREGRDIRKRRPKGAAARSAWYPKALARRRDYLTTVVAPLAELAGVGPVRVRALLDELDESAVSTMESEASDEAWQVAREEEVLGQLESVFMPSPVRAAA